MAWQRTPTDDPTRFESMQQIGSAQYYIVGRQDSANRWECTFTHFPSGILMNSPTGRTGNMNPAATDHFTATNQDQAEEIADQKISS